MISLQKGGREGQVLAMLKGDTKSFGIVLKWEFEVLAKMKGGTQKSTLCLLLGWEGANSLTES